MEMVYNCTAVIAGSNQQIETTLSNSLNSDN